MFRFTMNSALGIGNSVRFTFPVGFWTNQATCEVAGLVGQSPTTIVLHDKKTVICS